MGYQKDTPPLAESLQAETSERATEHDQFPDRLQRYGKAKFLSSAMSQYIREFHPDHQKLAATIEDCGSYLCFHDYYTVGQIKLAKACLCRKHLLCPLCAIRRGSKYVGEKKDQVTKILKDNPAYDLHMMTLTVKDGKSLIDRFNHLTTAIKRFMKRRHKNRGSEAEKILGAVWSVEVKRGKNSNLWHPHAHFVIVTEKSNSVDQGKLSREWLELTGDSFIVDVRPINKDSEDSMVKGFCEVFKYAVKFSDQSPDDTWHCFETLRNRRLLGSCGLLYGVKEPEILTDTPLDELPFIEYFYRYVPNKGYKYTPLKMGEYKTPAYPN